VAVVPPLADRPAPTQDAATLAGEIARGGARAAALWTERSPGGVRQAGDLWLELGSTTAPDSADAGAMERLRSARVDALESAARAFAWLADHETVAEARETAATRAEQAARRCGDLTPESGACAYWLGAALGLRARERPGQALPLLPDVETAFQRAAELDPRYEGGGPDRALSLLYARAPGWPAGPGDADLALEHARSAVAVGGATAPNLLALGESLLATGAHEEARAPLERALEIAGGDADDPDAREWAAEARRLLERARR